MAARRGEAARAVEVWGNPCNPRNPFNPRFRQWGGLTIERPKGAALGWKGEDLEEIKRGLEARAKFEKLTGNEIRFA